MIVYKKIEPLQRYIQNLREQGQSIGFAPTMGALHKGHMSLINASNKQCNVTVCSIFINPTQFNEKSDLDNYPVTLQSDLNLLLNQDADVVFIPDASEIYPQGMSYQMPYELGEMVQTLEGRKRPGHFDGVIQVVDRLLQIVRPDVLFMGQKDYQQFSIIQKMLDEKQSSIKLAVCPIIREDDGLAMSSRNVRLSSQDREDALLLNKTLQFVKANIHDKSIEALEQEAAKRLKHPNIRLEYFRIVDGKDLGPISNKTDHEIIVALVAAWVGAVRLIDNMIIQSVSEG